LYLLFRVFHWASTLFHSRGKKKLTKDTMLFLGIEMAGRTKNATPKFFPRVVLELPYKEIGGEGRGPKAEDFF
jgi:hypothetical protein